MSSPPSRATAPRASTSVHDSATGLRALRSTARPTATPPHELDAFRYWQATCDPAARDDLVVGHLGLAYAMAQRYASRGIDRDDLRQVAVVGLIKAVDRFDPDRGIAFSSFAVPTILGEVKRHFRDQGWTIRVPRRVQELRRRVERARRQLEQEHGASPGLAEIAEHLDEEPHDVLEAMDVGSCYQPDSLEDRSRTELPDPGGAATDACSRAEVERLLERLPDRERRIFVLRYYGGMTQQEIADRVGISQMHVSRLLRRGLRDLRESAA